MNKIKKGLGRGLSSLIGETKIEDLKMNCQLESYRIDFNLKF